MCAVPPARNLRDLAVATILTIAVTALCYRFYFLLAPIIWQQNLKPEPGEIVPWVIPFTAERDGIELYALYIMTFTAIGGSFLLCAWFLRQNWNPWSRTSCEPSTFRLWLGTALGGVFAV